MDGGGRQTFTIVGVYEDQANSFLMGSGRHEHHHLHPDFDRLPRVGLLAGRVFLFLYRGSAGFGLPVVRRGVCGVFLTTASMRKNESMHCEAQSLESMVKEVNDMMGTMSTAIAVIAGISLLVGGIGRDEHHAGFRYRAYQGDRSEKGNRSP